MHIAILGGDASHAAELEEALADYGLKWDVAWVADPLGALSMSGERPIDVLVSDFVVGAHHGPALLAQLRQHHPEAVRILMLDPGLDADAMQALDCAHRLLRKPLEAGALIEAVESVVELRELLDNSELKDTIGRIDALPPPPKLYIELNQLMYDPNASAADIATVLSQDPAIAAKVLRLCNSAYFSVNRTVTDIRSAVTRLGQHTLRRLVLASEIFGGPNIAPGIDREGIQDRALRTSRLAGHLLGGSSAELAATAGLLAEVGMLLPGVSIPRPDGSDWGNPDGPHYAEAGAYLLGLWGLPMAIVEGVAHHRRPARVRSVGFWVAGAVHVASSLVSGQPLDEGYLDSMELTGRLPKWREMAQQLAAAS